MMLPTDVARPEPAVREGLYPPARRGDPGGSVADARRGFRLAGLIFLVSSLLVSGCAINPKPIDDAELQRVNGLDRKAAVALVPLDGPLTIEEATARVLKFNLEHRTRLLQQSLAVAQFDVSKFDMLPKMIAGVGYTTRDRENIRRAVDSVTGLPSLSNPFITSEKTHTTADLGLTWNLLDFGVSYYAAKQNADRLLVAGQRRRQAMHELIQRTRSAFWRAIAATRLEQAVRDNLREAESALADSQKMLERRIKAPQEALRYQRNLLENLRLLESVKRELSSARIELASLIGAEPGSRFELVEPQRTRAGLLDMDAEQMEQIALLSNAELREEHYNVRIAALETRKSLVKLLPGLSFNYGFNYDNDDFLIHDQWREGGLRATFNLLNLLAMPRQKRASEAAEAVAESRRMALQMAVLTQVHLGRNYYASVVRQHQRAEQIAAIDQQLASFSAKQARSGMSSDLDRIAANVVAIMSAVRRYQSIARVEEAASQLQATLGLEPDIASLDDLSLPQLTAIMREELHRTYQMASPATQPEAASTTGEAK